MTLLSSKVRWHSTDYRERDSTRARVHRGFWLYAPRLIPLCRLLGHRVVVDGVDMSGPGTRANPRRSRWACCDRCGVRLAQPIDSDLEIGQPYTAPLPVVPPSADDFQRGVLGAELVALGGHGGLSVEVKIGNRGSEHTLAGHVHLHKLGALYLHTERYGTWLQRRLNPTGYDSRVIGVSAHDGRFRWQVWARRNEHRRSDPRWMYGSVRIDPRDILLGEARYSYDDVGDPVVATVRMPHGDDHQVTFQLQRQSHGRPQSKRRELSWTADWSARPGIPTESANHGRFSGGAVKVSAAAAENGTWPAQAAANLAADLTRDRVRHQYRHTTPEGERT
jgi:hypothetical protein